MSTIKAILEIDADGTLHLPLPPEFLRGPLAVVATIEPVIQDAHENEARRQRELLAVTELIRARNPFKSIEDPVAWQREMREDVKLPFRD